MINNVSEITEVKTMTYMIELGNKNIKYFKITRVFLGHFYMEAKQNRLEKMDTKQNRLEKWADGRWMHVVQTTKMSSFGQQTITVDL